MATSPAVHGSGASFAGPLYDAAMTGSDVLDRLLEVDGSVSLSRIHLTSFAETPLHLAALLGHLEFTKRLLKFRPEFAFEQDSEKCMPLHLAAANGRVQVVRELLGANENACLVQDQDGRVPLHLAAMRGRCQAVLELLKSTQAQKSLKIKVDDGDGILHLCVKYNHLDVLKAVLASTGDDDGEVLKMTDSHGNTVLHLAVMLKQKKTVRFLVGLPTVKTEIMKTTNDMGLTALNVLNHSPKDCKSLKIREILVGVAPATGGPQASNWRRRVWPCLKSLMDYEGDSMKETRGSLMMVSTIIATVTFTAGMTPPGGVWQQDTNGPRPCSNESVCYAGTPVLAYYNRSRYLAFMKFNMTSFISSLVVIFLLISGFPLNNKFCLLLLSLVMCVTITFLCLTFVEALALMIPKPKSSDLIQIFIKFSRYEVVILTVWLLMIFIVGLWLLIRLSYWLVHIYNNMHLKSAWRRLLGFCSRVSKKELP